MGRRLRTKPLVRTAAALAAGLCAPAGAGTDVQDWLPPPVLKAMATHAITGEAVSLYVQHVDASEPLIAVREDVPRNPASVIKLVTSLAALETLGPVYTWTTEARADGTVANGRLAGNLFLKGYGDPYLTTERFWQFVRDIRIRGIHDISGSLVLDQSHFEHPSVDRAAFDGRPHRAYNALPAPLSVSFQATRLQFLPQAGTGKVGIYPDPPAANLNIDNGLQLVDAPCTGRHHSPVLRVMDETGRSTVRLKGRYASRCRESGMTRLVLDPSAHAAGGFTAMWRELGGTVDGGWRQGTTPAQARLVHSAESPPLADIVRGMNKYSNNLISRHLLLTLGAETYDPPGTLEKGRRAIAHWLASSDFALPALVIDNGSGLSRQARMSAGGMGRLLVSAFHGPYMPEFVSSLALAGIDGTMRRRFRRHALQGQAHIKTGSLNDVSAMAGYVRDRDGRRWAVVLFINNRGVRSWHGKPVQNALLRWIYDHASDREAVLLQVANRESRCADSVIGLPETADSPPLC